ncbi:MAG TPA: pre-toxin TG domain-containing protein [Myxococcaceae bacterium]|nr:pre-toxin TG domain-containing protein [Myxococcaceae bacterium]
MSPEEAERWKKVEAKLEEYLQWGMRLMETHVTHLRRIAPGHLLTEHPLREKSLNALVDATLAWAYAHTEDPDFLRRSPSEVALYLLASRSALATAIELGKRAPPHLDYTPPPEDTYTDEELVVELLVGFTPLLGEVTDLEAAFSGYSFTGHRLSNPERFIHVLGVVMPFANGKLLTKGGDAVLSRVALVTGRSVEEVRVLSRVASHLSPEDVTKLELLLRRAAERGGTLTDEDLTFLNRVAGKLEKPIGEAVEALRRGEKLPLLGARTLANGTRMLPGSAEHLAQCWVDYQFRHPGKYRRFSYAVDPEWERLYRSILANKPAGNAFEDSILKAGGYEKNTALMMPPPDSRLPGFIPDSVRGNPGELVWGKPYHFVEAKGRQELALSGNIEAMIDYVKKYGGHIELWIRASTHPAGQTRLTNPLQKALRDLSRDGKASIKYSP